MVDFENHNLDMPSLTDTRGSDAALSPPHTSVLRRCLRRGQIRLRGCHGESPNVLPRREF